MIRLADKVRVQAYLCEIAPKGATAGSTFAYAIGSKQGQKSADVRAFLDELVERGLAEIRVQPRPVVGHVQRHEPLTLYFATPLLLSQRPRSLSQAEQP